MREIHSEEHFRSSVIDSIQRILGSTASVLRSQEPTLYRGKLLTNGSILLGLSWYDLSGEPCKIEVKVVGHTLFYRAGQDMTREFDGRVASFQEEIERSILEDIYRGRCVFTYDEEGMSF